MSKDSGRKAPKIKIPLKWDPKAYKCVIDALTLTCIPPALKPPFEVLRKTNFRDGKECRVDSGGEIWG